jgi:hypothetical protein
METSSPAPHSSYPPNNGRDMARLEHRLPALLSAVAGTVDVIGFLSLKLFTAHVTGNLVVIAALLVRGGPPNVNQILAVPVFILAVGCVWLIAEALNRRGAALARPLLLFQFLLLTCVLIVCVAFRSTAHPNGLSPSIAGMVAVSAMAGCAVDGRHDRQPDEDRPIFAGHAVAKAGCGRRQRTTEKDPAACRSILHRLPGRRCRTVMARRLGLVPSSCACRHGTDTELHATPTTRSPITEFRDQALYKIRTSTRKFLSKLLTGKLGSPAWIRTTSKRGPVRSASC